MSRSRHQSFTHVTIIGVGLIGGSLAMAIRNRFPSCVVTGVDRAEVLRKAIRRGVIDIAADSVRSAVCKADLVILSAPIPAILRHLPLVARCVRPDAVVTDTGSVKDAIVSHAHRLFPHGNFVGGHPMTGSEFSGVRAAHPLLFENAFFLLTPDRATSRQDLKRLSGFYSALGARVAVMSPSAHDSVVAALSHVPQLSAVALIRAAARQTNVKRHLRLGAGGFRDMTRVASSPFGLWKDILEHNRKEIRRSLGVLVRELDEYRRLLWKGPRGLRTQFQRAASIRSNIPRGMKGFLSQLPELTVYIPDRPGTLAMITTALARKGVNIKDLELLKVREGLGGTFRMAFESVKERDRARKIVHAAIGAGLEQTSRPRKPPRLR